MSVKVIDQIKYVKNMRLQADYQTNDWQNNPRLLVMDNWRVMTTSTFSYTVKAD